jgi:purine-binding chemotaxis protein CheW
VVIVEIEEKESVKEFEVLSFIVGDQEMAFDVDYVEMVFDKTEITPVPKSKPMIKGIINLRGRIVPIIDLADVLGSYVDESGYESIVVIKYNDIEAGFMVGMVKGVLRVSPNELESISS